MFSYHLSSGQREHVLYFVGVKFKKMLDHRFFSNCLLYIEFTKCGQQIPSPNYQSIVDVNNIYYTAIMETSIWHEWDICPSRPACESPEASCCQMLQTRHHEILYVCIWYWKHSHTDQYARKRLSMSLGSILRDASLNALLACSVMTNKVICPNCMHTTWYSMYFLRPAAVRTISKK